MKIAGEIIGIIGIIVNFLIYQQNDRKKVLRVKLLSDLTWALHYGLLFAFSGMAVTLIGATRETTFILTDDKEKGRKYYLVAFALIAIVTSLFTMKDIFGLLPAFASLVAVISYWQKNPLVTKLLGIPIATSMLIYDIMRFSITGLINEILTFISIAVSLTVILINKKTKNKNLKPE